jgi:hypothetical protein
MYKGFWRFVKKTESCWEWCGSTQSNYGIFYKRNGDMVKAHRLSYEKTKGPIPDGMFVLHRCDNPPCVRPSHLFIGTHFDNMQDRARKGRQ